MNRWATVSNVTRNGMMVTSVNIFSSSGVRIATRTLRGWDADLTLVVRNWRIEKVYA